MGGLPQSDILGGKRLIQVFISVVAMIQLRMTRRDSCQLEAMAPDLVNEKKSGNIKFEHDNEKNNLMKRIT